MSRANPSWVSRSPDVTYRTLNLREAFRVFGLRHEQIYAGVARGEIHAVERPPRDSRSAAGQLEYPEWELKKLAEMLGLTAPRVIRSVAEDESRLSYVHRLAA